MALKVSMPSVSGYVSSSQNLSNMANILSNRKKAEADRQAAADTQIFRQQQLANEGVRLGMLGDKNAYDMLGGERDKAAAQSLYDNQVLRDAQTASTATDAASLLQQGRVDVASNLATTNAISAGVQNQHEVDTAINLAGVNSATDATKVQTDIDAENRKVAQAASLRKVLSEEEIDSEQAALELGQKQRIDTTNLTKDMLDQNIFSGVSPGNIKELIKRNDYFSSLNNSTPSHTAELGDSSEQQKVIDGFNKQFGDNIETFVSAEDVTAQVNQLADDKGWSNEKRSEQLTRSLAKYRKTNPVDTDILREQAAVNQKDLIDIISGSAGSNESSNSTSQNLINQQYISGVQIKEAEYVDKWIEKIGGSPGERGVLRKGFEAIPGVENLVSRANIQPVLGWFGKNGIRAPAVTHALESLSYIEGGQWKTLNPDEIIKDSEVRNKILKVAEKFQDIGTNSIIGSGSLSIPKRIELAKAAQADGKIELQNIAARGQYQGVGEEQRLNYILSQLPKNAPKYERSDVPADAAPDPKNAAKIFQNVIGQNSGTGGLLNQANVAQAGQPVVNQPQIFSGPNRRGPGGTGYQPVTQTNQTASNSAASLFGNNFGSTAVSAKKAQQYTKVQSRLANLPVPSLRTSSQVKLARSLNKQLVKFAPK